MGFAPDKQLPWSRCSHDFNTINCYRQDIQKWHFFVNDCRIRSESFLRPLRLLRMKYLEEILKWYTHCLGMTYYVNFLKGLGSNKFQIKLPKLYIVFFSIFPLVPHWKPWKKSCLNKLKFWEPSRNHKRSLSWMFQYSILKNAETSHIPASISENPVPL